MVNITDVDLDVRPALIVAEGAKDLLGTFCGGERSIVFPEQNERLDGRNQRAGFFLGISDLAKDPDRFLVKVQRLLIVAEHVQRIGFGAQAAAEALLVSQTTRDGHARFRKEKSLTGVSAELSANKVVGLAEDRVVKKLPMGCDVTFPAGIRAETCQLDEHLIGERRSFFLGGHENPVSSRRLRKRS